MRPSFTDHKYTVLQFFLKTTDDWHPCWNEDEVKVSVIRMKRLRKSEGLEERGWRICLWGADDDGMERDFDKGDDGEDLRDILEEALSIPEPITKSWLRQKGYVQA